MTAEVKKAQAETESLGSARKAQDFVAEIKSELTKIDWTSPEELRVYTKIVVVATFLLGIGIYIVDLTIQAVLGLLGFVVHWISG
jgi:preprotein translocase subunit SecE